jgi:hypothetical protein
VTDPAPINGNTAASLTADDGGGFFVASAIYGEPVSGSWKLAFRYCSRERPAVQGQNESTFPRNR